MLNTDLHNPGVKDRMTLEAFIKNNATFGLPGDYLTNIYKNIAFDPLLAAFPRFYDFTKTEEIFSVIKSKKNFNLEKIQEMIELDDEVDDQNNDEKTRFTPNKHLYYFYNAKLDKLNFPYISCFENFNYIFSDESTQINYCRKDKIIKFLEEKQSLEKQLEKQAELIEHQPLEKQLEIYSQLQSESQIENHNEAINKTNTSKHSTSYLKELIYLIWEDFFHNFMILPKKMNSSS